MRLPSSCPSSTMTSSTSSTSSTIASRMTSSSDLTDSFQQLSSPRLFDEMPLNTLMYIDYRKTAALRQRTQLAIVPNNGCKTFYLPVISTDMLRLVKNDDDHSFVYESTAVNVAQHALYCDRIPLGMVHQVTQLMPSLTVLRIHQGGTIVDVPNMEERSGFAGGEFTRETMD